METFHRSFDEFNYMLCAPSLWFKHLLQTHSPADPRSWCPLWEELTAISSTQNSVCPLPQWHIMEEIMLTLAENSADVITVS